MKLLFAALTGGSLLFALPAAAQDTGTSAAAPDRGFNGIYIGGSFGYTAQPSGAGNSILFDRDLNGSFGDTVTTSTGANAFSPGFCNGAARTNSPDGGCDTDRDGIEYFGRIGADGQFGHFVAGLVGEFGKSEAENAVSAFSTTPASYTLSREFDYNASSRGRLGWTPNNATLFYATGGGAYAKVKNRFTTTNTANSFTPTSYDEDAWGYAVGGGVEQRIGQHFSIGLEYLYTRLDQDEDDGTVRVGAGTAPSTNPFLLGNANGTDLRRSDDRINTHSMRVTAAFRF